MKKMIVLSVRGAVLSFLTLCLISGTLAWNFHNGCSRLHSGVPRGVYLGEIPMERKLPAEVRTIVEEENMRLFRRPRNAFIDHQSDQLLEEVYGQMIDVPATVKMITEGEADTVYDPIIILLEPEITIGIYRDITERKSSFATWYENGGRATNIEMAASAINNYLLAPGEVFSFNTVTGHSNPRRGYQPAPIIVGNTIVPGYGGGVCQVSTTLYNAVLGAGLEIVERYPHSRPVGYVPDGKDATVSDHLDFKFRNSTNRYILIKGGGGGYCVYFEIWSSPDGVDTSTTQSIGRQSLTGGQGSPKLAYTIFMPDRRKVVYGDNGNKSACLDQKNAPCPGPAASQLYEQTGGRAGSLCSDKGPCCA